MTQLAKQNQFVEFAERDKNGYEIDVQHPLKTMPSPTYSAVSNEAKHKFTFTTKITEGWYLYELYIEPYGHMDSGIVKISANATMCYALVYNEDIPSASALAFSVDSKDVTAESDLYLGNTSTLKLWRLS